jgi:UDP-glucuronate 4-epimerase
VQRILITGASGYLGRCLVDRWAALPGTEVHGLWLTHEERLLRGLPANVQYHRCDIADPNALSRVFAGERIDVVIHAAALLPDGAPHYLSRAVRANVLGTAQLADCAAAAGVRRFVYCSSISVYGDASRSAGGWREENPPAPNSVYGWSKAAGEQCVALACAGSPMTAVILRLAGIHGGGRRDGALYRFVSSALVARTLTINNPTAPFQLLFLDDATEAVWHAAAASVAASAVRVNVASHVFPSMRAFAECIVGMTASGSDVAAGAPGDERGDVMDISRMHDVLGYAPPPAELRLREYCAMLRAAAS